jgi:signal transduction histidine kinase/HPt (histidine-containing phosphotransfer) domain-containing protein
MNAPAAALAGAPGMVGWRGLGAVLGLSFAGVAAPIAVTAMVATSGPLGPPLVASALVALLVLAPAGVGLATALSGLRRVAATLSAACDGEAEQAVLRVFVTTLVFGYSLGLAAVKANSGQAGPYVPGPYLPIAAFALVAAWTLLLQLILFPVAPPVRRWAAMALDLVMLSAFLHVGGGEVAGWYPLYLLASCYAGLRFGLGILLGATISSILGFAAVIVSTDAWWQQPILASGLILALALLPVLLAGAIRAITAARAATVQAQADRRRILMLIADNLRGPIAEVTQVAIEPAMTAPGVRTLASRIGGVADFAALEAGAFAPPVEAFDLRALVNHSLVPLQAAAAERGVELRWRVDPHLPIRLRGRAQAVARILGGVASHAVEVAPVGTVRMALDAVAGDARRLRLRLRVGSPGGDREPGLTPDLAPGEGTLALIHVRRLVTLIGGEFAIDRTSGQRIPGQRTRLAITLPLMTEEGEAAPVLDLGNRAILIATEDDEFAGELAELLEPWNGDARWIGGADAVLAGLSRRDTPEPPVLVPLLIIDGRGKLLSALSLAHHAVQSGGIAAFVLLVADAAQIASLGEVDEGEIDGFIPAPVSGELLANALRALPFGPLGPDLPLGTLEQHPDPARVPSGKRPEPGEPTEHANERTGERTRERTEERIASIATHPKFAHDTAATLDMRAIDGLRALDGGPAFLREVIESFEADTQQIMERIDQAVASADAARFAQCLVALGRAASPLGGTQLCELLGSLQDLTASELRQQGAVHVQRLDAEIDRLSAALIELLPTAEARLS